MAQENKKSMEKVEKEAQELYMELNVITQQTNELQKQIQQLEETVQEIQESKKGLEELSKQEKGTEILVPIVSGIFAKAEIKDSKEFIVNVGANTAVTKSIEEVKKLLDKQEEEMQKAQYNLIETLQKLTVKARDLKKELESLVG